jgi:hypothetical protein
MLGTLSQEVQRRASGRNVLIVLLLFLVFNMVILPPVITNFEVTSNGAGLVDILYAYTPEELYSHIASFDAQGRRLYTLHELTIDLLYPMISALLFSLAIAYLLRRTLPATHPAQRLALVPLAAMLADYLENICIVLILASYPERLRGLALVANVFTVSKWAFACVELLLIVGCLIGFLFQKVRKAALTARASPGETP